MKRFIFGLMGLMLVGVRAEAQVINFDDIASPAVCEWGGGSALTDYQGFSWTGLRPLNLVNYTTVCGRSTNTGYVPVTAGNNALAIAFGPATVKRTDGGLFTLDKFLAGSGWSDPVNLEVSWLFNGITTSQNFTLVTSAPLSVLMGIDAELVTFTPTWGADTFNSVAEGGPYNTFYLDNIELTKAGGNSESVVPEPSTYLLMATGLAGIFGYRNRRKS